MGQVRQSAMAEKSKDARILIVDDMMQNVLQLTRMLENAGYRNITGSTDSREVKALHEKYCYDLILLDLQMPHLDGFQVMEQLSEVECQGYLPILVLTASEDNETKLNALAAGAKDFVLKPFNQVEVLMRISNMVEVRLLHRAAKEQNNSLEICVEHRTREVVETRLDIIHRLGRAAEFRDNETGLHIIRMSKYAELIARAIGMDEEFCNNILQASPMHDIGKIGIPDAILLKPGKLDAKEWEIMKTHSIIGADILSGATGELLEMARIIALTHHEKWNGGGYPNGLSGENIPIEGRIAAVADVFDALTSERPYKRAWTFEEAYAELKKISGSHLQEELVDAFLALKTEILEIRDEYAEPALESERVLERG